MRGMIIAAAQSGSGKTAFTQALVRLFHSREHNVVPAKVGPDYIDPQFLSLAAQGRPCINLDPWAMRAKSRHAIVAEIDHQFHQPLWIVEGVMGLFDVAANSNGSAGGGSSADLAAEFNLPVVLVIDAKRQATSVAALVQGFCRFRDDVTVAAVVLNRVDSARHEQMLRAALATHCPQCPILAVVPQHDSWHTPSRHLGLSLPDGVQTCQQRQQRMAEHLARCLDNKVLAGLLEKLSSPVPSPAPLADHDTANALLSTPAQHIAMAQDAAFCFFYSAQALLWRKAGVKISTFSPLADETPDPQAKCILLPGGYPELHAETLARAEQFRLGMHRAAEQGVAIYGECGGYMTLGESLTVSGQSWPMLSLLPARFHFSDQRRRALGYRRLRCVTNTPWGRSGQYWRGHEFHYAHVEPSDSVQPLFHVEDANGVTGGDTGMVCGRISGSFQHLIDRVA